MSENSGEQQPHKFSRVPDIKTARQNIARHRDEKQVRLIQRALGRKDVQESEGYEEHNDDEIRSALLSVVNEIGQTAELGKNPFRNMSAARLINERVGPLLSEKTRLKSLRLPDKEILLVLKTDPRYDPEIIQRLVDAPSLRSAYNSTVGPLHYEKFTTTVGQLQTRTLRELAAQRGMTPQKVLFSQAAFKPVR